VQAVVVSLQHHEVTRTIIDLLDRVIHRFDETLDAEDFWLLPDEERPEPIVRPLADEWSG
jgi:hypothetical protein